MADRGHPHAHAGRAFRGGPRRRRKGVGAAAARADIQKTLGFVPQFFLKMPELALPGAWEEMKGLQMNPGTALPGSTKELIGLAVAAQVPCRYCIYAHTEFAKLNGASDEEMGEAVAMAALTRHWSTVLNGIQTDEAQFRAEIAKLVAGAKQAAASHAPAPKPGVVTDGRARSRTWPRCWGLRARVPEAVPGDRPRRGLARVQGRAAEPDHRALAASTRS